MKKRARYRLCWKCGLKTAYGFKKFRNKSVLFCRCKEGPSAPSVYEGESEMVKLERWMEEWKALLLAFHGKFPLSATRGL